MRCASPTLHLNAPADARWLRPVTQLIHAVRSLPQDETVDRGGRDVAGRPAGHEGGRTFMWRIIIAAAIAIGLIALWVAMLPLAA